MPKYKIIREDPLKYRNQILLYWRKYLPGTPDVRFEWMQNNPAGPAIWLFAIEESSGDLAGTLSLFPKNLYLQKNHIKAAILGDLMVNDTYRIYGPIPKLLNAAKAFHERGDFDLLYTIPNYKSKPFIRKAGFTVAVKCCTIVYPQRINEFLSRYVGNVGSQLLKYPSLTFFKILSLNTYTFCHGKIEIGSWHDVALIKFLDQFNDKNNYNITGEYSVAYFDWRYRSNPEQDFSILIYKESHINNILGIIIFSLFQNRLIIYDILSSNDKIVPEIIKALTLFSKENKCHGIYMLIGKNHSLIDILKKYSFIDTKDEIEVYTFSNLFEGIDKWNFTSGDRNI